MKSAIAILGLGISLMTLGGCNQASSGSSSDQAAATASNDKVLTFDSEENYQEQLAVPGTSKKELNSAVGGKVIMKSFSIAGKDSDEWEKGGKLLIFNDYSMGSDTKVTCALSPQQGDMVMKQVMMKPVRIEGTIASFSSSDGLRIDPCQMTDNVGTETSQTPSQAPATTASSVSSSPPAQGSAEKAAFDASTVTPAMIVGKWVSEYDGLNGCQGPKSVTYNRDATFTADSRRGKFTLSDDFLTEQDESGGITRYNYVRNNDDEILARKENGPVYRLLRCPTKPALGG